MLALPCLEMGDFEQEIRVGGAVGTSIDDDGGRDELADRHPGHVDAVLAGDPVDGRVEVCADVLAHRDIVPVSGWSGFVVVTDFVETEVLCVREGWRKLEHWRALGKRRRQVKHINAPGCQVRQQVVEKGHHTSSETPHLSLRHRLA
jgi:hypothetical protein